MVYKSRTTELWNGLEEKAIQIIQLYIDFFLNSLTLYAECFVSGEVFVKIKDRDDQGWCTGRKDGRVGLYPDNYVEVL